MPTPRRLLPFLAGLASVAFVAAPSDPPGRGGRADADGSTWWSYRPLTRPDVPAVSGPDAAGRPFVHNPIDAFVLARLDAAGLVPSPRAADATLIRRVTFDLTGLPPTPEEVAAYVADARADKYERLVDRLLASSQYGVTWARHWLDVVRFAETDSFERDRLKPGAWRFRDWVVDSLNADKPYDRFLTEQLAGDELPDRSFETMVATGYFHLGIRDDEPTDPLQAVFDDFDGMVDTTARAMLGISMGCARCHDHKKDPIPTRDYYRMLAFFEGLKPYKEGGGNGISQGNFVKRLPVDFGERDFDRELEAWRRQHDAAAREAVDLAEEALGRLPESERAALLTGWRAGLVFEEAEVLTAPRRLDRPVQDDFSISCWFRAERPGRGNDRDARWFLGSGLVDAEIHGVVDDFGLALVGSRVVAGVGNPETFLKSPAGLADRTWHHVVFTRHRESGRVALYVDGALVDAATGGKQALDANPDLWIGRSTLRDDAFPGEIRQVRIHERAVDAAGVLDLWQDGGFAPGVADAVEAKVGAPERARYEAAVARLLGLERPTREQVDVLCAQEDPARVPESFVRERGNAHAKGAKVEPGFPEVLGGGAPERIAPPEHGDSTGRRLAFARWLTRPDHPLTWRVIVNRVWMHHFGRGISRTPDDFGKLGEAPTHPELLDWLASEFVARGARLKDLHRLIVTSATYRQSSAPRDEVLQGDPVNDLFSRAPIRRLTAEGVRDSILAVAGNLNLEMGGPGIYPEMPRAVLETSSRPDAAWGRSSPEQAARRSIYVHVKRSLVMPLLQAFDLADTDTSCPVRFVTTLPTQALTMLNSDLLNQQAAILRDRVVAERDVLEKQLARGLELVTQRPARDVEVEALCRLHADLGAEHGCDTAEALRLCCLTLLNLNEFVYVD